MKKNSFLIFGLVLLLATTPARASVEWSGFASFGGGITTASDEKIHGYSSDLGFKPDTLFALQASSFISDRLSVTVQFMARGEDDFDVGVEWAYLRYKLSDSWTINAGKLRLPMYSYSDSLDVGYTYHWLRPPASVYRAPFDTILGMNFTNNMMLGNALISTQIITGRFNDEIRFNREPVQADVHNIIGFNTTAEQGFWTLRGGYFVTNDVSLHVTNPNLLGLADILRAYGVPEAADALLAEGDKGSFGGVGFMYDNSDFFFGGEYTALRVPGSMVARQFSQYLTLGKRFGNYTVHGTFEQTKDSPARPERHLPTVPPITAQLPGLPPYSALAGFLQGAAASEVKRYDYYTLGVRYDFDRGVALKLDITKLNDTRGNADANLISFAVQTVF